MTTGQKIWRAVVEPVFGRISSLIEQRRLRKSFVRPFVKGGRDSVRFYEKGRWMTIEAELMSGSGELDRLIYWRLPLKWNDSGEPLTPDEKERVLREVTAHLDAAGIKWKFRDASPARGV